MEFIGRVTPPGRPSLKPCEIGESSHEQSLSPRTFFARPPKGTSDRKAAADGLLKAVNQLKEDQP